MYLIYLLVFKIFKLAKTQILFFSIGIFAYCVVCRLLDLGTYWYQTIPCMVLGMIYCNKKNHIDVVLQKYAWRIFGLFSILFAVSFLLSVMTKIMVLFDVLYSLFFVCAMISLSYIFCNTSLIENKFTKLCGEYSLEIYVTHSLFLRLIKLKYIENIPLYIITVIIGTILMSLITKKIHTKIMSFFKRME